MSLRDALLQAGVVSKKQVNKANRDLKKARKAEQGHREKKSVLRAREQEEARARADTRREERLEARRRLRDLQEAQARTHRVRQLMRHHGVTGTRGAPIRFHHRALQGDTLHCMELPLSLARGLADGRNGIAALVQPYLDDTEYYVVPRHVAERIAEVDPGAIILLNDERPDDDPAAGFIDDFVPRTPWDPDQPLAPLAGGAVILICYTTPAGGRDRMGQAARTLGEARRRTRPEADVRVTPTPTREDFVRALAGADPIEELHLVSDGDADGPRFAGGEALSPEDWRALDIPFAPGAEAFFHAGRSARWFAPFFARTFGVPASGYHWDAAFSVKPHRFWWMPPTHPPEAPLWRIACPGPQTHGVMGAFRRAAGQTLAEPLKRFDPTWPLPAEAAG